ncbi:Pca regulon regulatory protein [compost metagenome]
MQVREQGWCIVDQELEQSLRSVAVPVRDASGQVLAAMNVSTHAGRVSRQELETRFLPVLLAGSKELGAQLWR